MARYFLHLRDGGEDTIDREGIEYADLDGVRHGVLTAARDLMAGDIQAGTIDLGCRIDAEDERGELVCSLKFGDAVKIIKAA